MRTAIRPSSSTPLDPMQDFLAGMNRQVKQLQRSDSIGKAPDDNTNQPEEEESPEKKKGDDFTFWPPWW